MLGRRDEGNFYTQDNALSSCGLFGSFFRAAYVNLRDYLRFFRLFSSLTLAFYSPEGYYSLYAANNCAYVSTPKAKGSKVVFKKAQVAPSCIPDGFFWIRQRLSAGEKGIESVGS